MVHIGEGPQIPFNRDDAFFPLRRSKIDPSKIVPTYQTRVCAKKFLGICTHREIKRAEFPDLEWFYANGFGLSKRRKPGQ
jgi:hypothetical protein